MLEFGYTYIDKDDCLTDQEIIKISLIFILIVTLLTVFPKNVYAIGFNYFSEAQQMKRLKNSLLDKSPLSIHPTVTGIWTDSPRFHGELRPKVPNKKLSINKFFLKNIIPVIFDLTFLRIIAPLVDNSLFLAAEDKMSSPPLSPAGTNFVQTDLTNIVLYVFYSSLLNE